MSQTSKDAEPEPVLHTQPLMCFTHSWFFHSLSSFLAYLSLLMFHGTSPCISSTHAGYFCSSGSSEPSPISKTSGDVCPVGHFCPQGSSSPTPCPVGSFLPECGASSSSQCHGCPPGEYCSSTGSSQPTGLVFIQVTTFMPLSLINADVCKI